MWYLSVAISILVSAPVLQRFYSTLTNLNASCVIGQVKTSLVSANILQKVPIALLGAHARAFKSISYLTTSTMSSHLYKSLITWVTSAPSRGESDANVKQHEILNSTGNVPASPPALTLLIMRESFGVEVREDFCREAWRRLSILKDLG